MSKKTPSRPTMVQRIGMAEARLKLPELAARLAKEPDRLVEVTRHGRPVLHLLAPPRVERQASAARRILRRLGELEDRAKSRPAVDVARRCKAALYGRA